MRRSTNSRVVYLGSGPNRNRAVRRTPLEAELSELLGGLKKPRDRKLIARHLGWDGGPPCSLSEAGAVFQISRERARQVYAGAVPLIRRHGSAPSLDSILSYIRRHEQEPVSDVERELQEHGFTNDRFSLHGVLTAARLLGRNPGVDLVRFGGTWFVGEVSKVGRAILVTAAKRVEHHGATRISVVRQDVGRRLEGRIKDRLVRQILETREDLCWLDPAGDWFWLSSVSRNRLLTRVEKVLAVFPRIRVSKLHHAISRDYKPLRIPESVLRSICASLPWCHVVGDDVRASTELDAAAILSGGEAIACTILREHGGSLELSQLESQCYAAGVKRANLWRILSFSPLIQRLDREVYGFIGPAEPARRSLEGLARHSLRDGERCMQS